MIKISFQNEAGELEAITAKDEEEAAEKLANMITQMGMVQGGDRFIVTEEG